MLPRHGRNDPCVDLSAVVRARVDAAEVEVAIYYAKQNDVVAQVDAEGLAFPSAPELTIDAPTSRILIRTQLLTVAAAIRFSPACRAPLIERRPFRLRRP
jgi:hypothetical protein